MTGQTYRLDVMEAPAQSQSDYCLVDTRNPGPDDHYLSDPWPIYSCKKPKNHEGRHSAELNWNVYVQAESGCAGVHFRFNTYGGHGSGRLYLKSRADFDATIQFFSLIRDQEFPHD